MEGPYDASRVETHWYDRWEDAGLFAPSDDTDREPFVIAIPPPNITGALHNGHVMFVAYQDLMIRWYRMRGRAALWIPGTDHAAIATQAVIERELRREGTSRHEIGRESFERRFWQWRDTFGSRITQQLRRLGTSADWTRERFTMDEQLSRAVREAFVRLYERASSIAGNTWSTGAARTARPSATSRLSTRPSTGTSGTSATRSRTAATLWLPPPAPKRCSGTPPWRCIRTTSDIAIWSAARPSCPESGVKSPSSPIPRWTVSLAPAP